MKAGDVLVSLDALPVRSAAELQVALRSAGADDVVRIAFERDGVAVEATVPARRAQCDEGILYDDVTRDGTRLRTLVARPSLSPVKSPAVLFVQGLSIATIELAHAELFRALVAEGFVTMRVEKRGVGDSEGEAPDRVDFATDVADVRAALDTLTRYDFVDPSAVFVFGHSIGGMIVPLLEADDMLRGALIYGSSAAPWLECLEAGARRQGALRGQRPEVVEERVLALRDELDTQAVIDGRPALYHRQLDNADVAAAWVRSRTPVLVLHGEHDWVVGEDESRRIAELARGELRVIPRADHLFTAHDSLEESLRSYGKGRFEARIPSETCAWMRAKRKDV
jgi:alpha-beta hydrolase superfamily lysophospholipase